MATQISNAVKSGHTPISDGAGEVVASRGIFPIIAAVPLNDVIELVILPEDHVPVDFTLDLDDLDTATGLVLDVGLITGVPGDVSASRVCGQEFAAGSTLGQTGGVLRASIAKAFRQVATPVQRGVGLKIATAATTPIVGSLAGLTNRGAWRPGTVYATNDYVTLDIGVVMYASTGGTSSVPAQPDTNVSPVAYEPNWNLGKGLTTTDGTVTWTCQTPIIGLTLFSRPAIKNF